MFLHCEMHEILTAARTGGPEIDNMLPRDQLCRELATLACSTLVQLASTPHVPTRLPGTLLVEGQGQTLRLTFTLPLTLLMVSTVVPQAFQCPWPQRVVVQWATKTLLLSTRGRQQYCGTANEGFTHLMFRNCTAWLWVVAIHTNLCITSLVWYTLISCLTLGSLITVNDNFK